ncbi:coiled-coil domain-containing protein 12-like [Portunus trituberculatus]|uniref:coiled-coil domain-containing protein 12-like n=1 Tax=Portunus trituberculatus TaxID=210409 RepID=UPI001E1CEC28|nr:coiled-coil domain-containing protein 12-like [Portunus trituberculatus]
MRGKDASPHSFWSCFPRSTMGLREDKVGSLENEAKRRREKLLALKRKSRRDDTAEDEQQGQEGGGDEGGEGSKDGEELPATQVLFRNYKPESGTLQEVALPAEAPADVEMLVKTQLDDGEKAKEEVQVEITNLAPKKITFDLKRCIQPQLDKLERRTDKAIAELIRQRLKEGKQQDFLIAVNAGARANQKASFDSDED